VTIRVSPSVTELKATPSTLVVRDPAGGAIAVPARIV
jgi:hypothetical protein